MAGLSPPFRFLDRLSQTSVRLEAAQAEFVAAGDELCQVRRALRDWFDAFERVAGRSATSPQDLVLFCNDLKEESIKARMPPASSVADNRAGT